MEQEASAVRHEADIDEADMPRPRKRVLLDPGAETDDAGYPGPRSR